MNLSQQGQVTPVSLTTPVPRDEDVTFPGEGWFYYWKTSASLWRSKIQDFHQGPTLVVPLNWSFHSDTGDTYDFAQHRPETDLHKLCQIATELSKRVVFYLPLTPVPYLPNGGLPHFLARSISQDEDGLAQVAVDADGTIHKFYSYFDSRVYQAFTRFTHELSQYFFKMKINADVVGMRATSYSRHGGLKSMMTDRSMVFEQSFSRFLKAKIEDSKGVLEGRDHEAVLKYEYVEVIEKLYEQNAAKAFKSHWEGTLSCCFLGASQTDFFDRVGNHHSSTQYSQDLLEMLTMEQLPSSVLLPIRVKKHVLKQQCQDLIVQTFMMNRLERYDDEETMLFTPLVYFDVQALHPKVIKRDHDWVSNGLLPYLRVTHPNCFALRAPHLKPFFEENDWEERVYFYLAEGLDQATYHEMLKRFMSGGRVILDRSRISPEYQKKLEVFILENNLQAEKINFHTQIQHIRLGEGRLILIEGLTLDSLDEGKLFQFWTKILETFSLPILELNLPDGVLSFWRTRCAHAHELNYEEIRRLSLYNPSSYKKKFTISLPKTMVLLKVVDQFYVEVQTKPSTLEIMMSPEGSVSLDFGVFS
jgi:hypothetical protein